VSCMLTPDNRYLTVGAHQRQIICHLEGPYTFRNMSVLASVLFQDRHHTVSCAGERDDEEERPCAVSRAENVD
jgi:hypothetical protein